MSFVRDSSPVTAVATVEGVFGAAYFGVGRGVGAMAGGWGWERAGARNTMQVYKKIVLSSDL